MASYRELDSSGFQYCLVQKETTQNNHLILTKFREYLIARFWEEIIIGVSKFRDFFFLLFYLYLRAVTA